MIKFKLPEELTEFRYPEMLSASEILKENRYDKPDPLLELLHSKQDGKKMNVPVMTRSNISCIQGKAKSRKTFFLVLLTSLITQQRKDVKITITDTEQYNYHSAAALARINKLSPHNNVRLFNLRKYSIDVRLEFMENYILNEKPDIFFLDNIRDCMMDINSWTETNKILTTLSQLSDSTGTHICVTLHENPSADTNKARGAIGTELQNKCETVFKLEKDGEYTKVNGLFTRNIEFDPLEFRISDMGLPELISDFEREVSPEKKVKTYLNPFD